MFDLDDKANMYDIKKTELVKINTKYLINSVSTIITI
jgi:hypothetical protein